MKPISRSTRSTSHRSLRLLAGTAVLATALGTLSACGDDDKAGKDADKKTEPTSQATATPTDVDDSDDSDLDDLTSKVELIDAGSGDLQQLRLNVTEGQVETWTMEMTNDTEVMGQTVSMPMSFTMTSTVDEVDEETIETTLTYDDVKLDMSGIPGMPKGMMDQMTDLLKGMSVELDYDRLGAITDSDFALPADMPAELSGMLDQIGSQMTLNTAPFPAEPVGVGATWKSETPINTGGLTMEQVATYELVARDGDDYTIKIDSTMSPEPGATMEGVEITEGTTTVTGTIEGNLGQLGPNGTMDTVAKMTMSMGGQEMSTTSTVHLEITVSKN